MEYELAELLPIVADLAQKYAGFDSTSVTYEKAQMLMEAVVYCLNEYGDLSDGSALAAKMSVAEKYRIGLKTVLEKATYVKDIYNEMSFDFEDYGVIVLSNTVQKSIPEYMTRFDARFCPQQEIFSLDYPLMTDMYDMNGIDAVYRYICALKAEQEFLSKFDRNYVISILKKSNVQYEHMIENICKIILMNTIGHAVIGKSFYEKGFCKEEYKKLTAIFSSSSAADIKEILYSIILKIVQKEYNNDRDILLYLLADIENTAVRINTAVKNNQLDKIFVL